MCTRRYETYSERGWIPGLEDHVHFVDASGCHGVIGHLSGKASRGKTEKMYVVRAKRDMSLLHGVHHPSSVLDTPQYWPSEIV